MERSARPRADAAQAAGRPRATAAADRVGLWPVLHAPEAVDRVLLAGLVAVITGLDVLWRIEETRPPHWDMARHLGDSLVYRHLLGLSHPLWFFTTYRYYPPFVSWVTAVFYAVLANEAMWVAVLSNVVFIAILMFATYGLGKRLWSRPVGLLSAVFVVTTPMLVTAFKEYMLDAPLTAMVALTLYLLVRTGGFSSLRHSLLLGLVCGLGALTKWTFPFAVALPVGAVVAIAIFHSISERSLLRMRRLLLAVLVALLVAEVWYYPNLAVLHRDLSYNAGEAGVVRGSPPVGSLASLTWYFWNLVGNQLYLVPSLFLLGGVIHLFRDRDFARRNLVPVSTIVGTYVGFTLLRNKDPRFTDPMLPAIAILATSWLVYASSRARAWLGAAVVAYGAAAFLAISFGTGLLPGNVTVDLGSGAATGSIPGLDGRLTLFAQHGYIIGPPTTEDWHQRAVFRVIAAAPRRDRTFQFEGTDSIWFNTWGDSYYGFRYDARWARRLSGASFLIVRGSPDTEIPAAFTRIRSYTLPDGETLVLYRRRA